MLVWDIELASDYDRIHLVSEDDTQKIRFKGKSAAMGWHPVPVTYTRLPYLENSLRSNVTLMYSELLVCTSDTLKIIQDALVPDVEVLPLQCNEAELYALNVFPLINALDHDRAILEYSPTGFVSIKVYAFKQELIAEKLLFKIPERPAIIYATDRFKTLIETNGLTGIDFKKKVWEG